MKKLLKLAGTALLIYLAFTIFVHLVPPTPYEVDPEKAWADTLTIPYAFSPNTLIKSSDFNDNFTAITDVVNGNIDDTNLKNNGITASTKIIDGTVDLAAMGTGSVDTDEIVDYSIQPTDIDTDGIQTFNITDDAVTLAKIPDEEITMAKVEPNECWLKYQAFFNPDETGANNYHGLDTGTGLAAAKTNVMDTVAILDTTFTYMSVQLDVAPGAAQDWNILLVDQSGSTLFQCNITQSDTSCTYSTDYAATQGDSFAWQITPSPLPANAAWMRIQLCAVHP